MADGTKIEWTDATWTPVKGCTRVSPGCGGPGPHGGCYAEIMAARFSKPGQWGEGLAKIVTLPDGSKDHRWTGVIRFDERELLKPLSWQRPRRIFVCSTADLFHGGVTDEQIDKVFAVMALCPQHTFQVLTKRPERLREYMTSIDNGDGERLEGFRSALVEGTAQQIWHGRTGDASVDEWLAVHLPLPNVWLGTSVEDQLRANERIPHLMATPAAVRFLSCEPLLEAVNLRRIRIAPDHHTIVDALDGYAMVDTPGREREHAMIDWVIVGGESGPGARPMRPDWAQSLRDQCVDAGVAFFFKQWGAWSPVGGDDLREGDLLLTTGGFSSKGWWMRQRGKKAAGRLLDGVEHNGMPA